MKVQPAYHTPPPEEHTARVPRLVNLRWLMLALRENARAARAGGSLPWNDIDLYTRTATQIEQLIVRGIL
jgi:hypothetical protein